MKICPTCNLTYTDETLNFCLNDGAVLNPGPGEQNDQATIMMGQPPTTKQNSPFQNQTTPNFQTGSQPAWSAPSVAARPPKKSKAWLWVVGIIGGLLLIGGIALVGIVALIATTRVDKEKTDHDSGQNEGKKNGSTLTDDFSKANWVKENSQNGNSEYRNGEFFVSSKQIGYLYVLVTGNKTFTTWNATTTIKVRNVNGTPTNLGYGLVLHSNSVVALDKDYAFLIDSTKQSYRIVQHQNRDEKTLVNWTKLPAIRSGTQTNEIQVRDENGKMSLFINGQFATSVNDSVNFKDGVTGVYAGDAIPIAFSNLQLSK